LSYDNACKYLAEQYPADFVSWLLSVQSQNIQVLKTELTLEPIRADAVTFLQTANQILHIEFQTLPASNPPISFRMLDYSVRLKRQYRCDVEQVVIFLQATNDEIVFTEEYRDQLRWCRRQSHYIPSISRCSPVGTRSSPISSQPRTIALSYFDANRLPSSIAGAGSRTSR
jgi:predicted transposase YdaD